MPFVDYGQITAALLGESTLATLDERSQVTLLSVSICLERIRIHDTTGSHKTVYIIGGVKFVCYNASAGGRMCKLAISDVYANMGYGAVVAAGCVEKHKISRK